MAKTKRTRTRTALARWLEAQGRGSAEALARRADCSRATIAKLRDGYPCRVALARDVAAATDGAVSVAELLGLTADEVAS